MISPFLAFISIFIFIISSQALFIDIKICAAVVLCLYFDFVDNASALNAFVLCSFDSVVV